LDVILSEAQRAAGLGEQILDFSRRSYIETQPIDLGPLIEEVAETLRQTLPKSIRLFIEMGQEAYVVNANLTRVQRAVMNLVVNARDAMPEGGEVHIGLSRVEVQQDAEPPVAEMVPGEWVCITVSDTGFGFLPQDLPYIFEPFFTPKALGKRMGLELAQVYGIVMQHNGHIEVETTEKEGATFRIYLPACDVEEVQDAAEVEQDFTISQGRGETILLVEDEKNVRQAGERILESLGYRVLTATNGREALQVYQAAEEVDLVITDLVMPGMGGEELAQELAKMTPNLKILAITGYVSQETLQGLMDAGFLNVIHKPFTVDVLVKAIYRALGED
jgi:CheY-like chemotaxis protein